VKFPEKIKLKNDPQIIENELICATTNIFTKTEIPESYAAALHPLLFRDSFRYNAICIIKSL
jgi:hypothetical protein